MKADAASDVMNVCVDGWVEDVESDQMQSERKKESDQWPAAIENEDLTGTGQLAISEREIFSSKNIPFCFLLKIQADSRT